MIAAILKRSLAARDGIGRRGALVPDFRTHVWRDRPEIEFTISSRNLRRRDFEGGAGIFDWRLFRRSDSPKPKSVTVKRYNRVRGDPPECVNH